MPTRSPGAVAVRGAPTARKTRTRRTALEKELIGLYAQIAALTAPDCASGECMTPGSLDLGMLRREVLPMPDRCCVAEFCQDAISWAAQRWGVDLPTTGHPTLPLMGDDGCTAPPHLRPACSIHHCGVAAHGEKVGDRRLRWTTKYIALQERIVELERARLAGPNGKTRS